MKSFMSCNDLINIVKKPHRNRHLRGDEIWKQLQMLNEFKSSFFNIKQGPHIKYAKLNKKVQIKSVLDEIQTKLC